MSVIGTVKNGVIVLPPGTKLPEGVEVKIETVESTVANDPVVLRANASDRKASATSSAVTSRPSRLRAMYAASLRP